MTTLIADRSSRQKHVWRARIVLLSADGPGTVAIMRRTGKSGRCVWRWQERFAEEGLEGLLRDRTRPSRIAPLGLKIAVRVVALTRRSAGRDEEWTGVMMARAAGISASAVRLIGGRRIGKAHGLQPHRWRPFKLSNDPKFVAILKDIVGFMSTRRPMPSCCRWTRRAGSSRSSAPGPACP